MTLPTQAVSALNAIQRIAGAVGTALFAIILQHAITANLPRHPQGIQALAGMPSEQHAHVAPALAATSGITFWAAAALIATAPLPALLLPRPARERHAASTRASSEGHRTLNITRKGGKVVAIPLAPVLPGRSIWPRLNALTGRPPPTRSTSTSPATRSRRAVPPFRPPHRPRRRVRRARLERRPPRRHRDPRRQHPPPPRPPRPGRNQQLERQPLDREEPFCSPFVTNWSVLSSRSVIGHGAKSAPGGRHLPPWCQSG
jgi:hypothetical protein